VRSLPCDGPRHPFHGLYRLKTGFGGGIEHRCDSWDYPLWSGLLGEYRTAELVRAASQARSAP